MLSDNYSSLRDGCLADYLLSRLSAVSMLFGPGTCRVVGNPRISVRNGGTEAGRAAR